jgi:hypothetical protein
MPKVKISEYSQTAANNTDINSINLAEGMLPSDVNNAIRELMKQLKDFQVGAQGDGATFSSLNLTTTPLAVGSGGTGATSFSSGALLKGSGTSAVTTASAGTDYAGVATAQTFTKGQRGAIVTLTDAATVTPDMADGNNFSLTLGGNRTLANPSNLTAGQSGSIFLVQDGTGSRTLAYGSYYDFAGGTAPTLTTTASAVDRIDYVVRSTTSIHCVFTANYS